MASNRLESLNKTTLEYSHKLELQQYAEEVRKRQEQYMKERMERDLQRQSKIRSVEDDFQKWVEVKAQIYHSKIESAQKNKDQQIAKIVKRCKDRDKFVEKKISDFKAIKKRRLNEAWKKAENFNENIRKYYESKNQHSKQSGQSYHVNHEEYEADKERLSYKNQSVLVMNPSKIYNYNNESNAFYITQPRTQKKNMASQSSVDSVDLKERVDTIERVKEINRNEENLKIQQLGEKFEKIEKSRMRKTMKYAKKSKEHSPIERNSIGFEQEKKKKSETRAQHRLYSEQSWKNKTKIPNRMEETRARRDFMHQQYITSGDQYLQNIKVKHLKTVISKNIVYNTLQKKLYFQRLNS